MNFHPKRLHDLLPLLLDKVLCDWVLFLRYKGKENRSTGISAVWSWRALVRVAACLVCNITVQPACLVCNNNEELDYGGSTRELRPPQFPSNAGRINTLLTPLLVDQLQGTGVRETEKRCVCVWTWKVNWYQCQQQFWLVILFSFNRYCKCPNKIQTALTLIPESFWLCFLLDSLNLGNNLNLCFFENYIDGCNHLCSIWARLTYLQK